MTTAVSVYRLARAKVGEHKRRCAVPLNRLRKRQNVTMLKESGTTNSTMSDTRMISARVSFRVALPADGVALWRVVKAAGTLELNSPYFYALFATDFGDTCLIAEHDGNPIGAVIGYRPPREPEAAFVWQIGILPSYRGGGLGVKMLTAWFDLPANRCCRWLTATIAADNAASQALFHRFAREHRVRCHVSPHFTADMFPVPHPPEPIYRVGPLTRATAVPC